MRDNTAIRSFQVSFPETDVSELIREMENSISQANAFIQDMKI